MKYAPNLEDFMKIEQTTLIQFDEQRERARLMKHFSGIPQVQLLAVLDAVEAEQWSLACDVFNEMPAETAGFLHPTIRELLLDVKGQLHRKRAGEAASSVAAFNPLADFAGLPQGGEGDDYPKFRRLPDKPL